MIKNNFKFKNQWDILLQYVPECSTLLRVLASSISSLKRKETWIIYQWLWEAIFASKGIFTLCTLIQQKCIQIMQAIKSSSKHTRFESCDFCNSL